MRYIPSQNLLFIHMPSTYGTSVEHWLKQQFPETRKPYKQMLGDCGRHLRPQKSLEFVRRQGRQDVPKMFTSVREPVAWYRSLWRWMMGAYTRRQRRGSSLHDQLFQYDWHPLQSIEHCIPCEFGSFVIQLSRQYHYGFLTYLANEFIIPKMYVARCETLSEDLYRLTGVRSPLPRKNSSWWAAPHISKKVEQQILETEQPYVANYYGPETISYRESSDWN